MEIRAKFSFGKTEKVKEEKNNDKNVFINSYIYFLIVVDLSNFHLL